MTDATIGYSLMGAVVAFVLLRRFWPSGGSSGGSPVTLYEATGLYRTIEIFRPVTIIPRRPRRKVAWAVVIAGVVIVWVIISH